MNTIFIKICITLIALQVTFTGVQSEANQLDLQVINCPIEYNPYKPSDTQYEIDNIFSLLAYSVVFKNWQNNRDRGRGYNVGSVLVDTNNNIVCWARNAVNTNTNNTQHGELRLMVNYLNNTSNFNLSSYKLYTTLEACAMCGGMMTLNKLPLTIYGQTDPHYGDAIQRLEINSTSCGGYTSYPRPVTSVANQTHIRTELDDDFGNSGTTDIVGWLTSDNAKKIYSTANDSFRDFKVKNPANQHILESALSFLKNVPNTEPDGLLYNVNCPPSSDSGS